MLIELFENVSKRINSTYRPTNGITKDVRLKEPSDFLNPSFILADMNWNFTHVKAFNMYYRITNRVVLTNDLVEIKCRVDPMATGKDLIANYTCFVERSASRQTNYLDDTSVSVVGSVHKRVSKKSLFVDVLHPSDDHFDENGCYLIRVIAPPPVSIHDAGLSTGLVTYAIDRGELYKLLTYAFNDNNFVDVLADQTIKAVFNPIDYLVDIKWLPVTASAISMSTSTTNVPLGWWTTDAVAYPVLTVKPPTYVVKDPTYELEFTLTPPRYYNDYRLTSSRFTHAFIYVPAVGSIDVDPSNLLGDFSVKYVIDRVTGDAYAMVYSNIDETFDSKKLIGRYPAQLACKVNIAQSAVDMQGVVSNIVGGTASLYAGNYISGAMALVDVVPKVTNPTTKMIGENGSMGTLFQALWDGIQITTDSFDSGDQPNTCGKPLMKNVRIGDLSGFVKCGNASLATPFLEPINEEINSMLNSGFYFE